MKIQSHALLLAVASLLGATAHAQSNGAGNTSLNAIRSIVNPSLVIDDSFNRTTNIENTVDASRRSVTTVDASRRTDIQTVAPRVDMDKRISTNDLQTAANAASMNGADQRAQQGGFALTFVGGGGPSAYGGYGKSPAEVNQAYDVDASNKMLVEGNVSGSLTNQNLVNVGSGLLIGNSRLGNDLAQVAGAQTLGQAVEQHKDSATQTHASDRVSTTVSK